MVRLLAFISKVVPLARTRAEFADVAYWSPGPACNVPGLTIVAP